MAYDGGLMTNISLTIRYRPIRIGWCIRYGSWDDLRAALRLTHIFWGGKFNPIIPVGIASAKNLVSQFRVDVLFPINGSPEVVEFTRGSEALPWPLLENELALGYSTPNFLDISHPLSKIAKALRLYDKADRLEDAPQQAFESSDYVIVRWDDDDPLADILLATFGGLLPPDQTRRDYERFFLTNIGAFAYKARKGEPLPAQLIDRWSIADISAAELTWDRVPARSTMGFYAGKASEFEDVVNYWNLRASDLDVIFLDPSHAERMKQIRSAHGGEIQKRYEEHRQQVREYASVGWDADKIPIWSRSQSVVAALEFPKEDVPHYRHVEGFAIGADVKPPLHTFQRKAELASVADRYGRLTLSFQLPEKPFEPPEFSDEHFIVSLAAPWEDPDEWNTFWTPYIPSLNRWYGRQILASGRAARAEIDGIGTISSVTSENLTVTSLKKIDLATRIFEFAGIEATPSDPGRIAARVISQLGGLSGCRVLKIAGVRKLIREYGPLQEFNRTQAICSIGNLDPETRRPRFVEYERLFIEQRELSKKLKPEDAFLYLLSRGVFRVGITLTCTICELPFWISLDDASTEVTCEMCGGRFNVLRQLKTRDWKYRRSGIFGSDNHQEGSIPVALTLHQLQAHFYSTPGRSLFLPNMNLAPSKAEIPPCESDLFIAVQEGEDTLLAVGECKDAGGSITKEDATKMAAVADALSNSGLHCYIIFSKTAAFTADDVENCRLANQPGQTRVIMLSDRELEPDGIYSKASEHFEIGRHGSRMHDLAIATENIFFSPRPKKAITPTDTPR
jgi:hypothetical protein